MKIRLALVAPILFASSALAGNFSFHGSFNSDDDVRLFSFSLSSTTLVALQTYSYGGGTDTDGAVIPAGGFDPILTLYFANGTEIGSSDDDSSCTHSASRNGGCLDSYYTNNLDAGSYLVALTQSDNVPNGDLSDGFHEQGNGNFTTNGSCLAFCSESGNSTGNFALSISSVDSAQAANTAVPEPATFGLLAAAFSLTPFLRRRLANTFRSNR